MRDFSSAAYLGLRHPSDGLGAWERLTLAKPAALADPPGSAGAAASLARLQGCERATLATSTLHAFWDVCGLLSVANSQIFLDEGVYAVGRWGADRARARGVPVIAFRHYHPADLRDVLRRRLLPARRPVVLADGFCPACGRCAPLHGYLNAVAPLGGTIILDDTQALGILGARDRGAPGRTAGPYGRGGGGSLRWHDTAGRAGGRVLLVASLAKAFGAPVAAVSGPAAWIEHYEAASRTRVHCSPPAVPVVRAMARALRINRERGDDLRAKLAWLVCGLRAGLRAAGARCQRGSFPVQSIAVPQGWAALEFHEALLHRGLATVLNVAPGAGGARVTFIVNADHSAADIDAAARAVASLVPRARARRETARQAGVFT